MFTNTYHPIVGGIEKSIDTFAAEMRRLGHRVIVVAPEYDGHTESTEQVLRVPALKQVGGTPYSVKLTVPSATSARIRELEPDIVHSHQPFLLGDSAVRFARELDVPLVYTNHTFMERYLHWFPVDAQILQEIAEKLPVAYANLVDHVITPTQSVANVLRARGVETDITPIATGIDANFFASGDRRAARQSLGIDPGQLTIGHLGRLNPEKNLEYLARVALNFVRKAPEQRRFLLVGEGDSVDDIRALFTGHGMREQLIYAGLRTGRAAADAYAAMDAFLFTSLTDTQGLVLSEAMAAGNPVFALDAPGACDMVQHERNGYLLPRETEAEAFADVMDKLMSDQQHLAQLKDAAAEDAHKVSIGNCTRAMLQLYQTVQRKTHPDSAELSVWQRFNHRLEAEVDLALEKLTALTG